MSLLKSLRSQIGAPPVRVLQLLLWKPCIRQLHVHVACLRFVDSRFVDYFCASITIASHKQFGVGSGGQSIRKFAVILAYLRRL